MSILQISDVDLVLVAVALVIVAVVTIFLYLWWIGAVIFKKPLTGQESLVGKRGVARTDISVNDGEVTIDGVAWKAKLPDETVQRFVPKGTPVVVVKAETLTLEVKTA
jgi:membrane protein implicated in regulation of membrane protease activity